MMCPNPYRRFADTSAQGLKHTEVVEGISAAFELVVVGEIEEPMGDHVPFICDVVHVRRPQRLALGEPILFLGYRDFAMLGERRRFGFSIKP
jgi:hypothetical protein